MVRYVHSDTNFTVTDSGKSYLVRGGDRVAIYPPAIHKDPEIFEDPEVSIFLHFHGNISLLNHAKSKKRKKKRTVMFCV